MPSGAEMNHANEAQNGLCGVCWVFCFAESLSGSVQDVSMIYTDSAFQCSLLNTLQMNKVYSVVQ